MPRLNPIWCIRSCASNFIETSVFVLPWTKPAASFLVKRPFVVFLHKKLPARLKHVVSNVAWVKALIVFADVHVFAVLFAHVDVFVFVSVLTGLLWAVKENCTDPLLYHPVKLCSGFGDCTLFFYSIFLFCL